MEAPERLPITITILTEYSDRPIGGKDSIALELPPTMLVDEEGVGPVVVLDQALCRQLAEMSAANLGERLHHADYVVTRDPNEVERLIMTVDGCATCRQAAIRARHVLRTNPKTYMLVGTLYWAR